MLGSVEQQYCQFVQNMNKSKSFYELPEVNYSNGIFHDFSEFANIPGRWDKSDYIKSGALLGVAGLFMFADNSIRATVQKHHTSFNDKISEVSKYYSNEIYPFALSGVLYFSGLAFENSNLSKTGKILVESLIASRVIVQFIKILIGRSRPYMGKGNSFFKLFTLNNDFNSFPSGHTIVAFTTSTVLAGQIDNTYASIALYSLAALTAYQRIYDDQHWISDTVMGAILGYSIGRFFVSLNKQDDKETLFDRNLSFYPKISTNGLEFGFALSF